LPVDESGNRISDEPFELELIVDYSEKDFAESLIKEVNSDGGGTLLDEDKITEEMINVVVSNSNITKNEFLTTLIRKGVIDSACEFQDSVEINGETKSGYAWFIHDYGDMFNAVQRDKIRSSAEVKPKVKLRRENWGKIEDLWDKVTKRYMLRYEELTNEELGKLLDEMFDKTAFVISYGQIVSSKLEVKELVNELVPTTQSIESSKVFGLIEYGKFLKRLNKSTNLPVNLLHAKIVEVLKGEDNPAQYFNELTLSNLHDRFEKEFIKLFEQRYRYDSLDYTGAVSVKDNEGLVLELEQGLVGNEPYDDIDILEGYLYDRAVGDSNIEHEILKQNPRVGIDKILVFGKLPRRSIKVPTYTGGTTSPDFVYTITNQQGNIKLHALIEAKGKDSADLSGKELVALNAQEKLSKKWSESNVNVQIRLIQDAKQLGEKLREMLK
jgi:type III restriction enzyme